MCTVSNLQQARALCCLPSHITSCHYYHITAAVTLFLAYCLPRLLMMMIMINMMIILLYLPLRTYSSFSLLSWYITPEERTEQGERWAEEGERERDTQEFFGVFVACVVVVDVVCSKKWEKNTKIIISLLVRIWKQYTHSHGEQFSLLLHCCHHRPCVQFFIRLVVITLTLLSHNSNILFETFYAFFGGVYGIVNYWNQAVNVGVDWSVCERVKMDKGLVCKHVSAFV